MTADFHFDGKHPDSNDLFTIIFIGTIFVSMGSIYNVIDDLIIIFLISFSFNSKKEFEMGYGVMNG